MWRLLRWFVLGIVIALLIAIAFVTYSAPAHAGEDTVRSFTGIPIEGLFAVIGSMVALLYLDMKRDVRRLQNDAGKRGRKMDRLQFVLQAVAAKLNIHWPDDDD